MRQIFFDTETTGLSPHDGHRIIEIACVEMINRSLTGKYYHVYLNPEREIDQEAINIHGLTSDFLRNKPKFADIVDEFLAFIANAELIAHNAPFDVAFFNKELSRLSLPPIETCCSGIIDTLAMARAQFPAKSCSLNALCQRFDIDRSKRVKHGALIDSELLAQVYLAMTRGQKKLKTVAIYTDGACRGNPGPGGWGALLICGTAEKTLFGGKHDTTNNQMELTAVIEALQAIKRPCKIQLYTDSAYVKNGMTTWLAQWKQRSWKTAAGKAVKNQALWQQLDTLCARYEIEWHWVKGHAGDPGNERADQLANKGLESIL